MNLEKEYRDVDGESCNILQLVKEAPEWAANIIQHYEDRVAQMAAEVKRLRKELAEKKSNNSTLRKMLRGALEREKNKDAEVKRLHEECAKRRLDCKRLREERDAARAEVEQLRKK